MIYRFAAFELDEGTRELRLNGCGLSLQPRVFDLLTYLVRHRERVIGKDELLDALWPGVIVTEGSLQRAMSLARSALRHGGLENAIRTFSRQGYRFCPEVNVKEIHESTGKISNDLEHVRQDYKRGAWQQAIIGFHRIDHEAGGLEAADLECWAYAIQCTGQLAQAVAPLERAVAAYSAVGNRRGAARAALLLSHIQFEQREFAVAKGWHRRAASLLTEEPESREQGLLEVLTSRFAIADGLLELAEQCADNAHTLGRRLADSDIEALGLLYRGQALLGLGKVQRGLSLLDEAAALVLAGQISPSMGGVIYCGVVWGYRNLGDWQQAGQWMEHFTRWCDRSGLSTYSGACSLHRAEVLHIRGEFAKAEQAIQEACRLLPANAARLEGEAYRILGDLRLAQGDLPGAEAAFQRAHELGFDPLPGFALLQLFRGQGEAAIRSLERALEDHHWSNRQRRGLLLTHLAIIAASTGRLALADNALEALEALEAERNGWVSPALVAFRAQAWGEVAFAEGLVREAIASFQRAVEIWQEIGAPLHVANLRLRLAEFFMADTDLHAAELELSAAESMFRKLGTSRLLQRCNEIRSKFSATPESEL